MFGNNNLQDEAALREQTKILRRRQADEERRTRFLQAKTRLIGIDVKALDAQMAEKRQNKSDRKDYDDFLRIQAMEIERMLSASLDEEKRMKEFQIQQMKESWEEAKSQKKETMTRERAQLDFDYDRCGPASLLSFAGEDSNRTERLRLQKEQVRRWIQEQLAEKSYSRSMNKEDEMSYAEMIKAMEEIRDATGREEREMRKYIQDTINAHNKELADMQRTRNFHNNRISDEDGGAIPTSLNLFNEDKNLAMDANGKIIRKDMFKGFTEEQKRKMFEDNQDIMRHKLAMKEEESKREYDWYMQQILTLRAIEQAEFEEKMLKDSQKEEHLQSLRNQMQYESTMKAERDKSKFGTIDKGFFDGFGKSCR